MTRLTDKPRVRRVRVHCILAFAPGAGTPEDADDEDYPLTFDCELDPRDERRLRRGSLPTGSQGHFSAREVWTFRVDAEGTLHFDPGRDGESYPPVPTTFLKCEIRESVRFTAVEDGVTWEYEIRKLIPIGADPPVPDGYGRPKRKESWE